MVSHVRWVIDASNVIGSRPDGWWRDRAGAARRLIEEIREWAEEAGGDGVVVVLDAGPDDLLGERGGVEVVRAPRPGRDAADDEIVRLLAEAGDAGETTVATSDSALAGRVRALGAHVEGARTFRSRLASAP
jgi:predicted RNA-binding protein with PIN domain